MLSNKTSDKSTVEEIRARFDAEVERFSDFESGQTAAMDSPLCLQLIAETALQVTPESHDLLDIGCGAGNYSLALLQRRSGLRCTLLDLSQPMLERAYERVIQADAESVTLVREDVRRAAFGEGSFDLIVAAAVFHHLRDEGEWQEVFARLYQWLRPGGSVWIFDLIRSDIPAVAEVEWARYADYLTSLKGPSFRDEVFNYIEQEDTPRGLEWQLRLFSQVGFSQTEVLHKNGPFAAFGAIKGA